MSPEFSRTVDAETVSEAPRHIEIGADESERRRLAGRFGLKAVDRLSAKLTLVRRAGILHVDGRVEADVVQSCVVTGDALAVHVDEAIALRFVPDALASSLDEEIELSEEDCDTLPIEAGRIDLGELAAETLALALDPYPRSPEAEASLEEGMLGDESEAGPFAALKALRDRMEKGS